MTDQDIVQRLRAPVDQPIPFARKAEREEAADEIERLRSELWAIKHNTIERTFLTIHPQGMADPYHDPYHDPENVWTSKFDVIEIERLNKENFALAANQCHHGYGDDHGNHRCQYQDEIERLCTGIIDYLDGNHTARDGNGDYVETGEYFAALINPKGQQG